MGRRKQYQTVGRRPSHWDLGRRPDRGRGTTNKTYFEVCFHLVSCYFRFGLLLCCFVFTSFIYTEPVLSFQATTDAPFLQRPLVQWEVQQPMQRNATLLIIIHYCAAWSSRLKRILHLMGNPFNFSTVA
jgi:hypothetical protein